MRAHFPISSDGSRTLVSYGVLKFLNLYKYYCFWAVVQHTFTTFTSQSKSLSYKHRYIWGLSGQFSSRLKKGNNSKKIINQKTWDQKRINVQSIHTTVFRATSFYSWLEISSLLENAKVSAFHCLYAPLQMASAGTRGKKRGKNCLTFSIAWKG